MSWIQRAKPGDKVVCVNLEYTHPDFEIWGWTETDPQIGDIGTIREVFEESGLIWLKLAEFPGWDYSASHFRPVEPRKTDISFAHEILRKATKPVEENA